MNDLTARFVINNLSPGCLARLLVRASLPEGAKPLWEPYDSSLEAAGLTDSAGLTRDGLAVVEAARAVDGHGEPDPGADEDRAHEEWEAREV